MASTEPPSPTHSSHTNDNEQLELSFQPRPRLGPLKTIYTNTHTQVVFLGFVCFMCPGLFNALNGLGGGGQVDPTTSANANSALYATFAVAAFFAGSINNVLGSKITLLLGSIGYAIYIGSYLTINIHPSANGFVIAAGCILGVCAGLLWTAQGSLMLGYPTENEKGRFIAIFWSIFNLGGVVGASVSLGQNFHSEVSCAFVGNGTYIGFIILTGIGVLIPLLMVDPKHMVRSDGTRVPVPQHPSWKTEFEGLWVALRTDPYIVLLFPMFFASNWFYTWQFNDFNGAVFNIRARALNNLVYWLSQIVGSVSIGFLLDQQGISRRIRAFSGWCVLVFMVFVVHVWAYFYQKEYTRAIVLSPTFHKIDIFDRSYVGRIFLYICCGLLDSMWQTTAYWLMGAMSNNPSKLAHFSGFYKSIQSAGAAGIWRADAVGIPYMNMFISTWVLLVAGLVFAFPMIHMRVQEYTDEADDLYVSRACYW
ncbi:MFS general substrate transporter [Irpex lacteus]|nr:MFS general substrate transporter [Irpex lacteus]